MKNRFAFVGLSFVWLPTAAFASVAEPLPLPGPLLLLAVGAGAWGLLRIVRRK